MEETLGLSSAIRFRDTLGSPKETTGNGRTVDRVICESLPEDIYERDFLSKPLYFLTNTISAHRRNGGKYDVGDLGGNCGKELSL